MTWQDVRNEIIFSQLAKENKFNEKILQSVAFATLSIFDKGQSLNEISLIPAWYGLEVGKYNTSPQK
jgi:hypothetical protein